MALYLNNFKGRSNRKEKSKHLRDEFLSIETAFASLVSKNSAAYSSLYTNLTNSQVGPVIIDPANGYLQEITITETTTIEFKDPNGVDDTADTKRIALLVHGSNQMVMNGWGPQTWKEYGASALSDWLITYTGAGPYASMLIEALWDGKAWIGIVSSKNQNVDLVSSAAQAVFPFTDDLADIAVSDTVVLTRATPATVFDSNMNLMIRKTGDARFSGSRYVEGWVATPSDLQSVAFETDGVSVATEVAAGPAAENVDKLTFTATGGEIGCWILPHFGRIGTEADPIKVMVRFQAKMFSAATGTVRVVVALMGATGESPATHKTITVDLDNTWESYGHIFDIVTGGDLDSFDITNTNVKRTLVKISIKSPSGSVGSPVLVTNLQVEPLRFGQAELPSEVQDGTIGSSLTLAATAGSTGTWNDGTKALSLSEGEFVDFQDSLDIGKMYLMVASRTSGWSADVLLGKDQVFWQAYVNSGPDTKFVTDAPFTFRYEGGVVKLQSTRIASNYTLNIYECTGNVGVYDTSLDDLDDPVTYIIDEDSDVFINSHFGNGLVSEGAATINLVDVDNYRSFWEWTSVGLTDSADVNGEITSQMSEFGIDGWPGHGTLLQETKIDALGYKSLAVTIPADSNKYTFSIFVRKSFVLLGSGESIQAVSPQQSIGSTLSAGSKYFGIACLMNGGTAIGGDVLVVDIANITIGSSTDYSDTLVTEYANWVRYSVTLQNDSTHNQFEVRLYPAPGVTGADVTKTGWVIVDWAQLELENGDLLASYPVIGGETRNLESFASGLADGTLYDASSDEIGDITSGALTFDTDGKHKNILWSDTAIVAAYEAKHLHEFGPAPPASCAFEDLEDEDGNLMLDEANFQICSGENPPYIAHLPDLFHYYDFDAYRPAVSYATNNGYDMVGAYYGYGNDDGVVYTKGTNVTQGSGVGMRSGVNNCLQFGDSTSYRMIATPPSSSSGAHQSKTRYTSAAFSAVFWIYPTTLSAEQCIWSGGSSQLSEGTHLFIDTSGQLMWKGGPYTGSSGSLESFSTVATVNLNAWNMLVIRHDPATDTISLSVNGAAVEDYVYSFTPGTTRNIAMTLGALQTSSWASPALGNMRMQNYIFWGGRAITSADIEYIYNLGAGLTSAAFFGADNAWPAKALVGSDTNRPEVNWYAPSTYACSNGTAYGWAVSNGETIESLWGQQNHEGGFTATSGQEGIYTTNVQNGLAVVRFDGTQEYYGSIPNEDHVNGGDYVFTVFFAGSVSSLGATGPQVIYDVNGSATFIGSPANPLPKLVVTKDGSIGFWDGGSTAPTPVADTEIYNDSADDVGADRFFIGAITYINDGVKGWADVNVYINGALSNTSDVTDGIRVNMSQSGDPNNGAMFSDSYNNGNMFYGDVGEILFYREAMTPVDVIAVMDWMNAKWAAY